MTSIRRWLLGWLIASLAAAALAAGFGIFHTARSEANELFDYELRTVALSLPADIEGPASILKGVPDFRGLSEDRLFIEIWGKDGKSLYRSLEGIELPRFLPGIRTIEHGEYHWRVFGTQQGDRFIQVAQPVSVRDDLALQLALRTLWPLGLLIPAIIVIVMLVVRRGLTPLNSISRSLQARSFNSLAPLSLDGSIPIELKPLVDALDDLFLRLDSASRAQRIFIADAAHELRSPLTALKLQVQAAQRDEALSHGRQTLTRIEGRLNRVIHLVSQILALAREDARHVPAFTSFSLRKFCERVIANYMPLADARRIDLGLEFEGPGVNDPYTVTGDPHGIETLLGNLIDNAVRYTPEGGKVDVVLRHGSDGVAVSVLDSGPGIAVEDRDRVFDRFFRIAGTKEHGSGLGLAIAREIAAHHRAALTISDSPSGGLCITLKGLAS
ncbi:sensor histidine kinase N-terminal domain-containing protein [Candidimonas humi]|uniref:histidine kinase n=1 Tax=Candidimonas humi TaxID=683355 RepID=A0ABV8NW14_9BURK|nr:ATP-binding protein [Candidimonas humi]MBV6303535.1 sensor histidine kinase N-terminal domain-containing protein [Candidimonas humi]